jgi:phosphoribosyl 1,2-cyclic phosphodiesterase
MGKKPLPNQTNGNISASLKVKIWGARGSLPAPLSPSALQNHIRELLIDFLDWNKDKTNNIGSENQRLEAFLNSRPRHKLGGYGGNTPCVEVSSKKQQIIIDAGSGIRPLGYEMMGGSCGKGVGEVHIFFTHFHWDHLIGLPFFIPIFIPGNKIHVYSVQPELKEVFQSVFKKPYFPVALEQLASTIVYHQLEPRKPLMIGDIQVTPYQLDHPDPCWGFKVECNGRVYSHCVDTEGTRVTAEQLGPDLPLYQGVDVMIFDSQYTLMETIEKVNWGHATATLGLDIAMREGIHKVVFMHHDPASSNEKIAAAEIQARRYYEDQLKLARGASSHLKPVEWLFGYEGLVLDV